MLEEKALHINAYLLACASEILGIQFSAPTAEVRVRSASKVENASLAVSTRSYFYIFAKPSIIAKGPANLAPVLAISLESLLFAAIKNVTSEKISRRKRSYCRLEAD
jgi:hypothetical protein